MQIQRLHFQRLMMTLENQSSRLSLKIHKKSKLGKRIILLAVLGRLSNSNNQNLIEILMIPSEDYYRSKIELVKLNKM